MRTAHALWIVQGLLALVFLFTGGTRLFLPLEAVEGQMPVPLPGAFVRSLGAAELLGTIGPILPGLLRIRAGPTPLAAAGLAVVIGGAVVLKLVGVGAGPAFGPLVPRPDHRSVG